MSGSTDVELGSPGIAARGANGSRPTSAAYAPPLNFPGSPMHTYSE